MKIKLAELKAMEPSLEKLINKELKIKVAYKLAKLLKLVNAELKELEEQRIKLVNRYGKYNAEINQTEVTQDNSMEFFREYNSLMEEEIDINFEPIPLEEFGDIQLTTADVMSLYGIIITDNKEEKI